MAKGLRSKIKRHFRSLKREAVQQTPWQLEAEKKKQELLAAIIAAPKPSELEAAAAGGADAAAAAAEAGPSGMAVDGEGDAAAAAGEGSSGAKQLKKLRKQRLAKTKGLHIGKKKGKKALAGRKKW